MKHLLSLAAGITLAATSLGVNVETAHADANDMSSGVYWNTVDQGVRQSAIQDACGCTPSATNPRNGSYKDVVYHADNSTFEWDITYLTVHYYQNAAGNWVASQWTKRYSPTRSPNQWIDGLPR